MISGTEFLLASSRRAVESAGNFDIRARSAEMRGKAWKIAQFLWTKMRNIQSAASVDAMYRQKFATGVNIHSHSSGH
jgi:hypothetical protein